MGFLDNLKKRMAAPGAERYSEERFRAARPRLVRGGAPSPENGVPPVLMDVEAAARRRRRRILWAVTIVVAVLLVAAGTAGGIRAYREARTVQQKSVDLTISAPDAALSGETVRAEVALLNASRVVWENVVVEARIPDGFDAERTEPDAALEGGTARWGVGTLRPRESASFRVVGRLVGEEGTAAAFTATVTLTPQNAPGTRVEKSQLAAVRIDAIPVDIAVEAPRQAASGERVAVRVAYQNRTAVDIVNARLVVTTPEGFAVVSTDPAAGEDGRDLVWDFPLIPQRAEGAVTVAGTVEGEPEDARPFAAAIGFVSGDGSFLTQRRVQTTTVIARRALTVTQRFNNARDTLRVNPGDEVAGKIALLNTGDVGLRDLVATVSFSGTGLDPASVKTGGGFYDSRANTVTWSAASATALSVIRPGQSVELPVTFRMLPVASLPLTSPDDQQFSVSSKVTATSPDIPLSAGAEREVTSGRFDILLNSVMGIEMGAFYDDGRAGLPVSTGPRQPQVGEESVYTIRARVTNTSNAVVDAVYRAVLPEGVRWTGDAYATVGRVAFDERTREVRWDIGVIPPGAGAVLPGPESAFQVGITPSVNQVGSTPVLAKGSSLDGTDAFTTERLRAAAEAATTRLVDPQHADVVR